ncbi:AMP-dependent synthetase/ligase [Thiocystis violascens]|uniref:AMP-forming long-chain acyl-CoA synthetase n=1 Tax=Thiocystis violascens (strain ATCC 17096 / DSM 198 / 6111) TaxID=765911 RepID=I3Y7Q6_THIV6|nr:long-chain fatty acid--CoA ligase [Thiocystis violascens]AFL73024.1 AMP-forming long-chain acyl-CoA synthetase [Thiocystis violascens DSM 198]
MKTRTDFRSDVIPADAAGTLPELFRIRVRRTPDLVAYRQFDIAQAQWIDVTWQAMSERVGQWRRSLATLGLAPGERVAVQLRNGLDWVGYEQAALALGLVVVPLYPDDNPGNLSYILQDSDSRVLLVETLAQWRALAPLRERFPALTQVLCLEPSGAPPADDLTFSSVADFLRHETGEPPEHRAAPGDLATIVYTSGTTGRPKGVMLSHFSILWNAEAQLKMVLTDHDDIFLSFLPLSHTFERTVGYYFPMMAGSCVAYARSLQDLREDLLTIRPTVLISVPRIYERAYARIQEKLAEDGRLAQWLFSQAVELGWARFLAGQGRGDPPGRLDRLLWRLLRPLVADKVLARLGGRLRIAISGAAPLRAEVARCFIGLGLNLLEGYGLTESAPTIAGNPAEDNVPGSAGVPIPGMEIRIADNGELLARGPSVMLGYWKRPEETRTMIEPDGWLHTGDLAEMRDGHLFIRGRLKDILVMSTGEKVPAGDLERTILEDPWFEQALVLGEGRPFVAALLVLERQAWSALAASLSLDADDEGSLGDKRARAAVIERIGGLLSEFPAHEQVRGVHLLLTAWTLDNGLLTPTLKVKREEVERRFAEAIRMLYLDHD